jgi:spore germination cell wall hydrolase CwlJ-like protein
MVASAAIFLAAPTQALDSPSTPVTSPLLFHASANLDGEELSISPVASDSSLQAPEPAPVVEHAARAIDSTDSSDRSAGRRPLSELVGDYAASTTDGAEHECLASAVYFEAKGEPLQGQLSVAEVILNRTRSGRFPTSVCGVVKQRGQFSFVHAGRLPGVPRASASWRKAVAVAHIAKAELADGSAPKALFFHARRVAPSWRGVTRVAAVGNHVFYR